MVSRLSRPLGTLLRPQFPSPVRTMSSSTPKVREFLVILPDKPGVREKRLQVRPTHFKNMTPHLESGDWKMGGTSLPFAGRNPEPTTCPAKYSYSCAVGALLNDVPADDNPANFDFFGSTVVCKGESKEAVLELLKKDIYATSGVWDVEKIQIYPFICAFRNP
ncbi:Dimeric alpha-beta barrel [Metarhizium album ARSEF 1941]|uniref:Dimeric alpha-beta barrel n=1 Tax=Metarhizium album (strain ARSEF 1941) TaxID=1081103 RepID=A0A0B2WJL6_METAS|nr:Dimeric alpha-beta barrel [Metarhizium album ARSEF 1941]KHN93884.1 Dimeric alpha-beta barrel [Metarhizium album ARSEF 1941]